MEGKPVEPKPMEAGELKSRLDALLEQSEGVQPFSDLLHRVRPEDLAGVLQDFSTEEKVQIYDSLPSEIQAQVVAEADAQTQAELIEELPVATLAEIVEQMDPDDAADLVEQLPDTSRQRLLAELEPGSAQVLQTLLRHHPESAGGIMTSQLVAVRAEQSAGEALEILQQSLDTEVVSYVYVVSPQGKLEGVVSIREIIAADSETPIGELMHREVIAARADEDQEQVANLARKYNLNSVPVVDSEGRLLGAATIDDIVDIINEEADEDIYLLAGNPSHHPAQQSLLRRALIRIPWLILSLASGLLIALMGRGEPAVATPAAMLLIFIPLVVGVSGGVGTQSAMLIARGLATGEIETTRALRVVGQELAIGCCIALIMGSLVLSLVLTLGHLGFVPVHERLPLAVGTGLVCGVVVATINGTLIPLLCQAVHVDPALAAGPFTTSLNDVVGAFSYLTIARLILAH